MTVEAAADADADADVDAEARMTTATTAPSSPRGAEASEPPTNSPL